MTGSTDRARQAPDCGLAELAAVASSWQRGICRLGTLADLPGRRGRTLDDGVALGRLDIGCSNAGIFSPGRAGELDEGTWRDVIDTNLTGMWHACKAAVPHLVALAAAAGRS